VTTAKRSDFQNPDRQALIGTASIELYKQSVNPDRQVLIGTASIELYKQSVMEHSVPVAKLRRGIPTLHVSATLLAEFPSARLTTFTAEFLATTGAASAEATSRAASTETASGATPAIERGWAGLVDVVILLVWGVS